MVGMAAGADLLVAQTALELGLKVDAVLPMPLEHYAADFDAETLESLRVLLRHNNVHCVELPLPRRAHEGSALVISSAERDALYAHLTDHLVRCSSLLLALWDGENSILRGGTADTVLRYLGVRSEESGQDQDLAFVDTSDGWDSVFRLVYWVPTRRGSAPAKELEPRYLTGLGENMLQLYPAMPAQLQHQLSELNSYNREFEILQENTELGIPDSLLTTLPEDAPLRSRPMLERIDMQYGKADALAVHYQKRSDRLFTFFSVAALVMGAAYLSYERIAETRWFLFFYLFIFFFSFGLYFLVHGKRWFAKHLMYRALAETMRARFYLRVARADHLVNTDEVIALSGIDQFHGFNWISHALKSTESLRRSGDRHAHLDELRYVDHAWIESQQKYFTSKVSKLEQSSRRLTWLKNALFVVILLVLLILIVFAEAVHHIEVGFGITLSRLLTFFMGLIAILLGVWELHDNKMATRELLWQYRNQLSHFSRAKAQLSRATTWHRRKQILADLGKDSLMESYLWTIHRYHREHEPPGKT